VTFPFYDLTFYNSDIIYPQPLNRLVVSVWL